jgi:hypothetical protein
MALRYYIDQDVMNPDPFLLEDLLNEIKDAEGVGLNPPQLHRGREQC